MLREAYHERTVAMEEYVSETGECRAQFLLRYFGQTESAPCGTCDICRAAARRSVSADIRKATERWLREEIAARGGSYSLEDLREAFEARQLDLSPDWPSILRSLIDSGELPPPSL